MRVLLADESITTQKLVNVTLAGKVQEVIFANDSQDSLLKARRLRPELVLVDSQLPPERGLSLCEKLRSEGLKAKFILITREEEEGQFRGHPLLDSVLPKPFNSDQLMHSIAEALGQELPQDEAEEVTHVAAASAPETVAPSGTSDSSQGLRPTPGPFSSFRQAEEGGRGSTLAVEPEIAGGLSDKLAAIASEVFPTASTESEEREDFVSKNPFEDLERESPKPPASVEPSSEAAPIDEAPALPSFSKEELVDLATKEIQSWIERELPRLAEKQLKAVIADKVQSR